MLELSSITFWWHLPIEPFSVFAVIIYHVVLLDFIKLSQLRSTELCISWRSPPVCWGLSGTLTNAGYSIPVTSSWPKVAKACREWCVGPIGFHAASLSCPIICIPQAGIYPHTLLVRETYPLLFVVPENSYWDTINIPPDISTHTCYVLSPSKLFSSLKLNFKFFFSGY